MNSLEACYTCRYDHKVLCSTSRFRKVQGQTHLHRPTQTYTDLHRDRRRIDTKEPLQDRCGDIKHRSSAPDPPSHKPQRAWYFGKHVKHGYTTIHMLYWLWWQDFKITCMYQASYIIQRHLFQAMPICQKPQYPRSVCLNTIAYLKPRICK